MENRFSVGRSLILSAALSKEAPVDLRTGKLWYPPFGNRLYTVIVSLYYGFIDSRNYVGRIK